MSGTENALFKREVLQKVLERSEEAISGMERSIRDLQESANEETKSSAGDKYETGRAMAQLELDKLNQVLRERMSIRGLLQSVNPDKIFSTIQSGALVQTSFGNFFIIANAGEFRVGNQKFFVISHQSPLAKILIGKKAGDSAELNGKTIEIHTVI